MEYCQHPTCCGISGRQRYTAHKSRNGVSIHLKKSPLCLHPNGDRVAIFDDVYFTSLHCFLFFTGNRLANFMTGVPARRKTRQTFFVRPFANFATSCKTLPDLPISANQRKLVVRSSLHSLRSKYSTSNPAIGGGRVSSRHSTIRE